MPAASSTPATTRPPAASTASAPASSTRCRRSWSRRSGGTARSGSCGSSRGSRSVRVKKIGPARGTGTTVFFRPDSDDFSEGRVRRGDDPQRLEVSSYLHKGVKIVFENESDERRQAGLSALGRPRRLPEEDPRGALRNGRARSAVHVQSREQRRERPAAGARAAVDAVDRRARAQLRQRHSHGIGRHARERLPRGPRQGGPQFHRHAQPVAEGRDADGGGHPRRARRGAQRVRAGAAVPGADEGPAEQPRADVRRGLAGPPGARALAELQHHGGRIDRRPHHPVGARARSEPRRAAGGHAQERPRPAG